MGLVKNSKVKSLDREIFVSLYKAKRQLPIKRIAERLNVSWPTIDSHVKKLEQLGVVITHKTVRRTNVELNQEFLKQWSKIPGEKPNDRR